jgi:3-hydroxypropanoate dehydrogenase
MKWGPNVANSSPARLIFVRSGGQRTLACVSPGSQQGARSAGDGDRRHGPGFHEHLPKLFPHVDARAWFANDVAKRAESAMRNSSLQGGYLILAARALGLDCGPMSGFDPVKVDAAFWAGTSVKTNFICALGRGDPSKVFQRNPRLDFDEACQLA